MICFETEWNGTDGEELTSFEMEKNSQAERGNGVDSKRCARKRKRRAVNRAEKESIAKDVHGNGKEGQ